LVDIYQNIEVIKKNKHLNFVSKLTQKDKNKYYINERDGLKSEY